MGDLIVREPGDVAPVRQSQDLMQFVQGAISTAEPEKLPALLNAMFDFQLKVDARNAEIEFNRDFAAAIQEMPKVSKRGVIDMGSKGTMAFATYEDVDAAIRPIEAKYGFARSFTTAPTTEGIVMTLHLKHRSGHAETSTLQMPPDAGAGRNGMQARGSASSYAKRYLTLDKWNIVTVGVDNDAKTAESITAEQVDQIRDLLAEMGTTPNDARVLKWLKDRWGFDSVSRIQRDYFGEVMAGLEEKRRARQ